MPRQNKANLDLIEALRRREAGQTRRESPAHERRRPAEEIRVKRPPSTAVSARKAHPASAFAVAVLSLLDSYVRPPDRA